MTAIILQLNSAHPLCADHLSLYRPPPSPFFRRDTWRAQKHTAVIIQVRRDWMPRWEIKVIWINGLASSAPHPPLSSFWICWRGHVAVFSLSPDLYNAHIRGRRGFSKKRKKKKKEKKKERSLIKHPLQLTVFVHPTSGPETKALWHMADSARLPFSGWALTAREDAHGGQIHLITSVWPPLVRCDSPCHSSALTLLRD